VDSEFILVGTDRDASGIPWALLASDRNGALEFVGPAILNPPQAQSKAGSEDRRIPLFKFIGRKEPWLSPYFLIPVVSP